MEKRRGSRHAERWYAVVLTGHLESGVRYYARGTVKAISNANAEMELFERCKIQHPSINWTAPRAARSSTLESSPSLVVMFDTVTSFTIPEH